MVSSVNVRGSMCVLKIGIWLTNDRLSFLAAVLSKTSEVMRRQRIHSGSLYVRSMGSWGLVLLVIRVSNDGWPVERGVKFHLV